MSVTPLPLRRPAEVHYARLDGWFVDVAANRLQRDGRDVRLTPKAMAVLRELLASPGRVVRRDDLLGLVWRDGFPTDDVLTHAITEIRRAIEDDPRSPRVIETIPRVGYRLIGTLELCDAPRPNVVALPGGATTSAPERAVAAPAPPSTPAPGEARGVTAPQPPHRAIARFALLLCAAALVALIAARPGAQRAPMPAPAPSAPDALDVLALTSDPLREQFASLAPDGSRVAYVAVDMDNDSTAIRIKGVEPGAEAQTLGWSRPGAFYNFPTWSPDGRRLAYLHVQGEQCTIEVVALAGGEPRALAECWTRFVDYIDWSADGRSLLATRRLPDAEGRLQPTRIVTIDLDTGKTTPLAYAPLPVGEDDLQPRAAPDGRWIAFRRGAAPYSDLYLVPAGGGEARRLTTVGSRIRGFAWYPDGSALLFSSDHAGVQALYRVAIEDRRIEALGARNGWFPSTARHAPLVVFQEERRLAQLAEYAAPADATEVAAARAVAPSSRPDYFPRLSPRGNRLAFVSERSGTPQLWVHDFERDQSSMLTRIEGAGIAYPEWSPDQTAVLFVARGVAGSELMRAELATGRVERVSSADERVRFGSYAGNGAWIYFSSDRSGAWQVWRMRPDGSEVEQLTRLGGFDPRDPLGDGAIYYIRETERGLFRLDLATREERRVSGAVGYWNMDAYAVGADGVYVLGGDPGSSRMRLERVPFGDAPEASAVSGTSSVLAFDATGEINGAAIDPAGPRLVLSYIARDDTDLMLATLPPAGAAAEDIAAR